jgi:capsular polysaccharide transport system permease protein
MSASQSDVPRSFGDYRNGLKVQARALNALMIRELMTRYGRGNIGFLWLIVEPMILCAGVIGLRWMIQSHQEHGVPLVAMLLSGYMPLTLWRHLTNRGIFLLRRNMGMLYHRNITMLDTFAMTMSLEFLGCTFAYIVNYAALLLVGAVDPIQNYGLVIGGWYLMGILALGVTSAIAVLTEKYEATERFIGPLQYLILPISGFFFMVDWLPEAIQRLAWYIPMIHCFELTRDGFFGDAVPTHYTVAYPIIVAVVLLGIFVPMFERVRDSIQYS